MTVLEREQDKVLTHDDLSPYRGQWVALRDGHVVASDVDAVALRNQEEVREDDVITLVPNQTEGIFLL